MKIYTRRGDDGSTGLLGQGRVLKSAPRVEAYGSVDELNAALGVARAQDGNGWLAASLDSIQNRLFTVGAELASTTPEALGKVERIDGAAVTWLESEIDRLEADLAPLTQFIVPGGTALAAALHVARTVCRRAERRVVALAQNDTVSPEVVRYLNRLADLLFVMARWANHRAGVVDLPWQPGSRGGA
jgi:cob(I)alamin adenosyltransferase